MGTLNVKFPDDVSIALADMAAKTDGLVKPADLVVEMVQDALSAPARSAPPAPLAPRDITLHEAAEVILAHLAPDHRTLLLAIAADLGHPVEAFIMSYCHIAYDRGETAMVLGDRIPDGPARAVVNQPPSGCEMCGKPIKCGTRYCPEPDDGTPGCGRQAGLRIMHQKRPPEGRRTRVGIEPPQHDVVARQRLVQQQNEAAVAAGRTLTE